MFQMPPKTCFQIPSKTCFLGVVIRVIASVSTGEKPEGLCGQEAGPNPLRPEQMGSLCRGVLGGVASAHGSAFCKYGASRGLKH